MEQPAGHYIDYAVKFALATMTFEISNYNDVSYNITNLYAVESHQCRWWQHITSIHNFLLYHIYAAESKVSKYWIQIYTSLKEQFFRF